MNSMYLAYMSYWFLSPGMGLLTYCMGLDLNEFLNWKSPSLDLNCGNGSFTFMALGGRFHPSTDYAITDYRISEPASIHIDLGLDAVPEPLKAAEKLDFYHRLKVHDCNRLPFPAEDDYFNTIYCNALYWYQNPDQFLREVYRILAPGGEALFHVMTPKFCEPYDFLRIYFDPEMVDFIDRFKRSRETLNQPYIEKNHEQWRQSFLDAGFSVIAEKPTCPNMFANYFVNVQFNLVLEELYEVMSNIDLNLRHKVKQSWLDKIARFCYPILETAPKYSIEESPYIGFYIRK